MTTKTIDGLRYEVTKPKKTKVVKWSAKETFKLKRSELKEKIKAEKIKIDKINDNISKLKLEIKQAKAEYNLAKVIETLKDY